MKGVRVRLACGVITRDNTVEPMTDQALQRQISCYELLFPPLNSPPMSGLLDCCDQSFVRNTAVYIFFQQRNCAACFNSACILQQNVSPLYHQAPLEATQRAIAPSATKQARGIPRQHGCQEATEKYAIYGLFAGAFLEGQRGKRRTYICTPRQGRGALLLSQLVRQRPH